MNTIFTPHVTPEQIAQVNVDHIQLRHGVALVLVGRQGTGKTLIAQRIAARHGGTLTYCDAEHLASPVARGRMLDQEASVCIIDGAPISPLAVRALKTLLTVELALAHRAGREARKVRPPQFIVCVHEIDLHAAQLFMTGRLFDVVVLTPTLSGVALSRITPTTQADR